MASRWDQKPHNIWSIAYELKSMHLSCKIKQEGGRSSIHLNSIVLWLVFCQKRGYNPYTWPYKWLTEATTLYKSPSLTGRGPPCIKHKIFYISTCCIISSNNSMKAFLLKCVSKKVRTLIEFNPFMETTRRSQEPNNKPSLVVIQIRKPDGITVSLKCCIVETQQHPSFQ